MAKYPVGFRPMARLVSHKWLHLGGVITGARYQSQCDIARLVVLFKDKLLFAKSCVTQKTDRIANSLTTLNVAEILTISNN
jgi:hypothetical protein